MSSTWTALYRHVYPIDPDYGGAPTKLTLWLDNLGGLVLQIDEGDGASGTALFLPRQVAEDLAIALHARPLDGAA